MKCVQYAFQYTDEISVEMINLYSSNWNENKPGIITNYHFYQMQYFFNTYFSVSNSFERESGSTNKLNYY